MSTDTDDLFTLETAAEAANTEVDTEPNEDPLVIPTLNLASGSWVQFRRKDRVTGENIEWLRQARDLVDTKGTGSMYNTLMRRAMIILVTDWDVQDVNGKPLPLPNKDTEFKKIKLIGALDRKAIERHLQDHVLELIGDEDEKDDQGE